MKNPATPGHTCTLNVVQSSAVLMEVTQDPKNLNAPPLPSIGAIPPALKLINHLHTTKGVM